jgi:uncharacterized membrane protein
MHNLLLICLVLILGKINVVLIKKGYNKTSSFDALTGIWQSYTVAIIVLTLYLMFFNAKSWTEITTKCNWESSKWFLLAGLLSAASTIYYMPLVKTLDYSKLSLIKNPLSMALTIAISILFLGESLDRKAIIGFFMYLSIPFILTVF